MLRVTLRRASSGRIGALGMLLGVGGALDTLLGIGDALGTHLIANARPVWSPGAGRTGEAAFFAVFVFRGGGEGELAGGGDGGGTFG